MKTATSEEMSKSMKTIISVGQINWTNFENCHFKGVDREKSAVFKELTQSFRTYELRGQAKKKKL